MAAARQNRKEYDSGCSESSDYIKDEHNRKEEKKTLYAAVRLCVGKEEVQIISVDEIKDFDADKDAFPYYAYVSNGFDSEEDTIFEPATILGVAQTREELVSRTKRWPKPKKRRSAIIHELAQEALQSIDKPEEAVIQSTSKKQEPAIQMNYPQELKEKVAILKMKKLEFDVKSSSQAGLHKESKENVAKCSKKKSKKIKSTSVSSKDTSLNEKQFSPVRSSCQLISPVKSPSLLFKKKSSKKKSKKIKSTSISLKDTSLNEKQFSSGRSSCQLISPVKSPSLLFKEKSSETKWTAQKSPTLSSRKQPAVKSPIRHIGPVKSPIAHKKKSLKRKLALQESPHGTKSSVQLNSPMKSSTPTRKRKCLKRKSALQESPPVTKSLVQHDDESVSSPVESPVLSSTSNFSSRQKCTKKNISADTMSDEVMINPSTFPDLSNINSQKRFLEMSSAELENIGIHSSSPSAKKKLDFESEKTRTKSVMHNVTDPSKTNCNVMKKKGNKYQKKIRDYLYDSDDYENSDLPKIPKLSKWEDEKVNTETGFQTKKTMWHLHYGVSVPYKNWKLAMKAKTAYGFLRELVVPHIWAQEEFVKRCIQINRTINSKDRVELTPRKKEALRNGYVQFLIENGIIKAEVSTKEEKKARCRKIAKFGRELGIIIAQERMKMISKNATDENVSSSPDSS